MSILNKLEVRQRRIILLLIIGVIGFSLIGFFYDRMQEEKEIKKIARPNSFEEAAYIEMKIEYGEEGSEEVVDYEGKVGERRLTFEEGKQAMEDAFSAIEKGMLREGESQKGIRTGIDIPSRIEGNPVEISWESDRPELFLENGDLDFENLETDTEVQVFVKVLYGEEEEVRTYQLCLLKPEMSEEERIRERVKADVDKSLESGTEREVILPEKIAEFKIRYKEPMGKITPQILGGGILLLFLTYFLFKNQNEKKVKKREEELKDAYAYFTGRFVTLLGAGMNLLSIWKKLNQDKNFNESLNREIRMTVWEIENGKTEREAYENFGKRIGGMKYPKFSLVLTENLRQGSSQILKRLEAEAKEALLERKTNVKMIGETAGTRLLMPMMLELLLILLVIMLPAIKSI